MICTTPKLMQGETLKVSKKLNPCDEPEPETVEHEEGHVSTTDATVPANLMSKKKNNGPFDDEEEGSASKGLTLMIEAFRMRIVIRYDSITCFFLHKDGSLQFCLRGISIDLLHIALDNTCVHNRLVKIRNALRKTVLPAASVSVAVLDRVASAVAACSAALDTHPTLVAHLREHYQKKVVQKVCVTEAVEAVPANPTNNTPAVAAVAAVYENRITVPAGRGYLDLSIATHPLVFTVFTIITHVAVTLNCMQIKRIVGVTNPATLEKMQGDSYDQWLLLCYPFHLNVVTGTRLSEELALKAARNAAKSANSTLVEATDATLQSWARQLWFIKKANLLDYARSKDAPDLFDDVPADIWATAKKSFPTDLSPTTDDNSSTPEEKAPRRRQRKDKEDTKDAPDNTADAGARRKKPDANFITEANAKAYNRLLASHNLTNPQNQAVWKEVKEKKLLPRYTDGVLVTAPIEALCKEIKEKP